MTYIRIWNIPVCLAVFASSNFAYRADATLNKTATVAASSLKSHLPNHLAQGATPPKSDYQELNTFNEELTNRTKISRKAADLSDNWQQTGKTKSISQSIAFPELMRDIQPFSVKNFDLEDVPHSTENGYLLTKNEPPKNTNSQTDELEDLRQRFLFPPIPSSNANKNTGGIISTPGSSVASPIAFGAEYGDVFVGASYQTRTRYTHQNDGGVVFGFGLGDSKLVGLEVAISSFSTFREGFFTNGGISLKLHHLFPNALAIAFGIEDAAEFGVPDAGTSIYGVASKVFLLKNDATKLFSSITVSLGLGGGRFRSEYDVQKGIDSVNVFGSVALRIAEPISLIADWTGQDLTIGTSIAPFRRIPIVITPAVADVTGNAGDGARFVLGAGFGYSF
ncbi:hypothetical protein G7B40_026010 [Aetokthonos hydrillicola Thurmond2011]|jgi:hypothetical protein|uniref:Uncharacterized protein n=1 Tax=Aetokthonos hydrillicola Thurmond2011 TaxID=2712845 RepID=A0AAP5IFE5_9CYAN|nr:hypothetical protein [Aetokthonos hydrillicola]MBO3460274.1 hypothetical protein [Aetokthonos hydrillicola CCALA 1050]MBW4587628.1 hypothetical protein [Aetokthonos hydrillicola CCALA 1050]MDR9897990.1 hypothetical protein [Aetokthonos hydrillicola Thurmond2011]